MWFGIKALEPIRTSLDDAYDSLVQVMLDLAVAPIFLPSSDQPRLVSIRDACADRLTEILESDPSTAERWAALVPEMLDSGDLVSDLLVASTWRDYFALPMELFAGPQKDSRVLSATPNLTGLFDSDGLLPADDVHLLPQGIRVDDYSLHYHQFLRRNFDSHLHTELVGSLIGIASRGRAKLRIAIDERRLRLMSEHRDYFEKDYWWGPQIDDAAIDDLAAVGETVHGDPHQGSSVLDPYTALRVRWAADKGIKTCQIEEMVPLDEQRDGPVLVRYLHARRDTVEHVFVHCDGAVKAYDALEYPRQVGKGSDFPVLMAPSPRRSGPR